MLKKGYKIVMSRGDDIPFDQDELANVVTALKAGSSVRLRRGFFNPSFYVSIIDDKERNTRFLEDTKYEPAKRAAGMKPLADIFKDAKLQLPAPGKALTAKTDDHG